MPLFTPPFKHAGMIDASPVENFVSRERNVAYA